MMLVFASPLVALVLSAAPAATAPAEKPPAAHTASKPFVAITISKETTRITAPLRKDGYVDYVAALNAMCRQDVTPEDNAAVPFLKATGPRMIGEKCRPAYYRMLGIPPLPEQGDYYIPLDAYAKQQAAAKPSAAVPPGKPEELSDQLYAAMKRPWSAAERPLLAGWLAANEKPLALVIEASRRPRRYDPLITQDGQTVIGILLPALQQHREAARALSARAMLRIHEGKIDAAWQDLLACHRLARLAGQGPTLIEALVGIAVDGIACAGDQGLRQNVSLTAAQAEAMRADLSRLGPMPKMSEKIEVGERFMGLDAVGLLAREGVSSMAKLAGGTESDSVARGLANLASAVTIDWDHVLRMSNGWYDRLAAAAAKPTRAERKAAFSRIEQDLKKMAAESKDPTAIAVAALASPRKGVSQRIGQMLMALLLPAVQECVNVEDRATMVMELDKLGFALAAFRADRGQYPATSAELKPKYVADMPKDLFSGGDLHYRREGDGYLLYSIGVNGKDDGGKTDQDRKPGDDFDDLVIRVSAAKR